MQKAIITGATGAIGIALIQKLIKEETEVVVVCHKNSKRIDSIPNHPLVCIMECDLDELCKLPAMISHNGIDTKSAVFYHFAWDGTFGNARNNVEGQIRNIQYTIEAVRVANELGCKRFIGAGSQAEYGRCNFPLTPKTPAFPENGYGIAKLCAGNMSRLKCDELNMEHVWTRILSVYGPYDGENTLVSGMIKKLLEGEHVSCTKGEQIWDFLFAEDAAEAFYLLGCADGDIVNGKTYVIGSGDGRPLSEYINILKSVVSPSAKIGFGEIAYSPKQVMHLEADISELKQDVGFMPCISFEEGIARTLTWIDSRKEHGLK